ncbi:MAG: hypothetical protein GY754_41145 [bacterium]|nr:hypothetical protein [bacterium]
MAVTVSLEDVKKAWKNKDPNLPEYILALTQAPDPDQEVREGAFTFKEFWQEIRSYGFTDLSPEERKLYRVEQMKRLEADDAEAPLADRFFLYTILLELWKENGLYERDCLFRVIRDVPLKWGPWKALKKIFKEAEARKDTEMYGALAARFDRVYSEGYFQGEVSAFTLAYLTRRAWRYLRREGQFLPVCYADSAVDILSHYTDNTNWRRTWIANHIFFHTKKSNNDPCYDRREFNLYPYPPDLTRFRAFAELWQRSPRPLFLLLERARAEMVRNFAIAALKTDFPVALREVEPAWAVRLISVKSKTIDEFVVWLLENVPKFSQDNFKDLGLHDPILGLLNSGSQTARKYAAGYARVYARDLDLDKLIIFINHSDSIVRSLAKDLLQERDPREDVGLPVWGELLGTQYGNELAENMIQKHFGASELTGEWFTERLLADNSYKFATKHLLKIHSYESLTPQFFYDLFDNTRLTERLAGFIVQSLLTYPSLEPSFLKRLLVHPFTSKKIVQAINNDKLNLKDIGVDFLKTAAYRPMWDSSPLIAEFKEKENDRVHLGRDEALEFDTRLAGKVLNWLGDVRRFEPGEIGFEWLMQLVERTEPEYHDFAVDYMIKAFVPADFAEGSGEAGKEAETEGGADLKGESFLFTGKLATMTRKEAQDKVTGAKGKNSSGVTANLDYLVIGDDGSSLYGEGKKGSKQVKAESLIEKGSEMKIISETAFLQMLAGKQRSFSDDDTLRGCEKLWGMLVSPEREEDPLRLFAIRYIRQHHQDIGLKITDRPVDPGTEIPHEFLNYHRVRPLLTDKLGNLRGLGLELAKWELASWDFPLEELIKLCESRFMDVKNFIAKALLADESKEHARYRIAPERITADAAYRFCESLNNFTRDIGISLIQRDPGLAIPEELFRLTESPDRRMRYFVIRMIWELYRDKGITLSWIPPAEKEAEDADGKKAAPETEKRLPVKKPENLPADHDGMYSFMRRILFEIPPSKFSGKSTLVRALPARKAKLSLVEVFRDIAIEEQPFAQIVTPLLQEFMNSYGKSEKAACLVALTRIGKAEALRAGD